MKWIAGYVAAICVLLIVIAQSIFIPTFHMRPYFRWHYARHNVAETIGIDYDDLHFVTDELLDYMRGRRADLLVYAHVNGEYRQFFSDRDIRHMYDVRVLYEVGFIIRNIAFWLLLFLILGLILFKADVLKVLARCCREVLATVIILLVILAGVIAFDWDRAFVIFHEIFFDNDYWMLTHGTDPLIDMVGHPFFLYIAIIVGFLFVVFSAIIITVSSIYLHMTKPQNDVRIVARWYY